MAAVSFTPHPLLVPPILNRVFTFLEETDILHCISVCSVWSSEAKIALSNRISVTITCRRDLKTLLSRLAAFPLKNIVNLSFRNISLDLSPNEFSLLLRKTRYSLQSLSIDTCFIQTMEPIHCIIVNAKNLNCLTLDTLKTSPVGITEYSFRHAVLPIYKSSSEGCHTPISMPFLKSFKYMSYDSCVDSQETLLTKVIETFPNLESLTAKNLKTDSPEKYVSLRLPKLTSLTVYMVARPNMRQLNEIHVKVFQNLRLKLKKLVLLSVDTQIREGILREWIESQAETLQELTLEQIMNDHDASISCFPLQLPNLHSLILDRSFTKNINQIVSQKYFPQLRELELKFRQDSDWTKIFPKKVGKHENVKTLVVSFIDSTSLEKVLLCFPNLISLTIDHADDSLLSVVFKTSPKLKTLKCFDDEEKQKTLMTAVGVTGRQNSRPTTRRTQPYIGFLKDLEMLQLHFSVTPNVSIIRRGILDCPKIRTLLIVGCKLTKKLQKELSRKTQLRDLRLPKKILLYQKIIVEKERYSPVYFFGNYEDYFRRTTKIDDPEWSDCE